MPASHFNRPPTLLSGIQPAELFQLGVTLFLANGGTLDSDGILYGLLIGSLDARLERLRLKACFYYERGMEYFLFLLLFFCFA